MDQGRKSEIYLFLAIAEAEDENPVADGVEDSRDIV